LFADAAQCDNTSVAIGSAAAFTSPGLTVSVLDDTTTVFRATAQDAAGNVSACSDPVSYREDSAAPAAPTELATTPASPANDNSPRLKGVVAVGSTVGIFETADCSGAPAATGTASDFASPGVLVPVADDHTTGLRATATDAVGNVSACSAAVAYQEDSTAPNTSDDIPDEFRAAPVQITLTVTDVGGAGGGSTRYLIGANPGDPAVADSGALTYDPADKPLLKNGERVRYASTDAAGNTETAKMSAAAKIDEAAPSTTDDVPSARRNAPITVTLTAVDPAGGSGVAWTRYLIGANPADPADPANRPSVYDPKSKPTLNDGERIRYSSVDKVGNAEVARISTAAIVDTDALPVSPLPVPPAVVSPPPVSPPPTSAAPMSPAPVVGDLSVRKRCVRRAELTAPRGDASGLSFTFNLSVQATVRYVIKKRQGSPGKSTCPKAGGESPGGRGTRGSGPAGRATEVSTQERKGVPGNNTTSLATTSGVRVPTAARASKAGLARVPLVQIAQVRKLRPGTYILYVTATDSTGRVSNVVRIKFWVLTGR
jgi:hypothetical protein